MMMSIAILLLLGVTSLGAQERLPDTQEPVVEATQQESRVMESGVFFDLTLNNFITAMRGYHYTIASASSMVDQNDGTNVAMYHYSRSLQFVWIVGSQSNRVRLVTLIGSRSSRPEEVRGWINSCSMALAVIYPQMSGLERLSVINQALEGGSSRYNNALLTFTDDGRLSMTITATGTSS